MKLWNIFSFELGYLIRRTSTWLYVTVLFLFTLFMNGLTTPGDGVYPNNTFHITAVTVIGGLIWLIMGASIAGEAAARDVKLRMHPLTFTTPVTKLHYLGGRFFAAFIVNLLMVLCIPLGVMLSFYLPGVDEGTLLPFRPWAYASVFLLIALPNAFIATAVQFSLAALSRNVMTSYLASLLLAIVAQVIAIAVAKLFGNWDLVRLLDPVGVSGIVGNELATWTPTEKNTRLVTLQGLFLGNRLLWLGVAIGLLWLTYCRFSFTHPGSKKWWRHAKKTKSSVEFSVEKVNVHETISKMAQVQGSFGFSSQLRQVITIAWSSFKKIARHPIGLMLVAAIAFFSAVFSNRIMTQFGIPLLPTTQQVIEYLTSPVSNIGTPLVVIPLLLIYFMGELIWQERDEGLSDVTDVAPVPEWVLLSGKFLGLSLIVVVWMVLLMAGGISMQLSLKYDQLELGLYLQTLLGLQLVEYLLFALLCLVIHVVINRKFISYLILLLVLLFMAFPATFRIEHNMLIFGADPGWSYTDMRGFGATLKPWLWFKLYWIVWALLMVVVAKLLWARGKAQGFKDRFLSVPHRFTHPTKVAASICVVLLLTFVGFIFYNTNVLNKYQSNAALNERKAAYERQYSKYRNTLQPQLTATKLHVEIYPERNSVEIRAAYTLVNNDSVPIDSIHLASSSGILPTDVKFNLPATVVRIDKELGHQIHALKSPLQPGDSLQINFALHHEQQGFSNNGIDAHVIKNSTYFTNFDLLPTIGYQYYRELKDAVLRKKHYLKARPVLPSLYDLEARRKPFSTDQTTLETIVSTAKDEVAVAPGTLHKTWTAGDRRYFHYKAGGSIGGEYAILSGDYKVRESKWNDVTINIFYHPGHARNIAPMLKSVKASLEYFTEQFGPYPFEYLTVVERPGPGEGATADAGIIYYGEQYAILNPDDSPNGFDLPFYILAHEMAHQWWGMARLTPANVEGAGVLIEGLAVYAGMQVLEKNYGYGHLRQYVNYLHSSYEMPRSLASPSLLQANDPFLYYKKGGLAMYALSEYIGKDKVNRALRSLLQKRTSGALALPTTLDLYEDLQKETPDSLNYLLNDLFKENRYWRLKTKDMKATQIKGGEWQVTMKVVAHKVAVDDVGNEKEVPMNDWLEIGLYEEGQAFDKPLYLQMHRIRTGEQTIVVTVPRKPRRGGIDPNLLMIDLRLDDNIIELE